MNKRYVVKDSIKSFRTYKPNTDDFDIKLDANESNRNLGLIQSNIDLNKVNRYPDNYSLELRKEISKYIEIDKDEIMVGAGSSELLELIIKTFVNPKDSVLSVSPSFVMYEKYTMQSNGIYYTVPVKDGYKTVVEDLISKARIVNPKVIFLCTPNNPTGYTVTKSDIIKLLENVNSIVVVDEAYMEFSSEGDSVKDLINKYDNLIVNRTFSKAFALAGARLGYIIVNKNLIQTLYTIKTPYSVNSISQQLGILALNELSYLNENVKMIKYQKRILKDALSGLGLNVFPSDANFLYVQFDLFDLAEKLCEKRVLIRSFKNGFYRITVGDERENRILIERLEEIFYEENYDCKKNKRN